MGSLEETHTKAVATATTGQTPEDLFSLLGKRLDVFDKGIKILWGFGLAIVAITTAWITFQYRMASIETKEASLESEVRINKIYRAVNSRNIESIGRKLNVPMEHIPDEYEAAGGHP